MKNKFGVTSYSNTKSCLDFPKDYYLHHLLIKNHETPYRGLEPQDDGRTVTLGADINSLQTACLSTCPLVYPPVRSSTHDVVSLGVGFWSDVS